MPQIAHYGGRRFLPVNSSIFIFGPLRRAFLFALAVLFFCSSPSLNAEMRQDQSSAVKDAIALLVTPFGTATTFCVSESGLFVTCKRFVERVKGDNSLNIVIAPGEKDEKAFPAKIVRIVQDADLVVLKITPDRGLKTLKLSDDAKVEEASPVLALGFPMQNSVTIKDRGYQSLKGVPGIISSLNKKKGVLTSIQFAAPLGGGAVGGPVLDSDLNVIGIVSGAAVPEGFAIPATFLLAAMDSPIIQLAPDSAKPTEITVSVDWLRTAPADAKVSVEIATEGKSRKVDAQKTKEGQYRAKVAPPDSGKKATAAPLHVTLEFASGKMEGNIADRDIPVGGRPMPLHEIREIHRAENGTDFLADGVSVGTLAELESLTLDVGGNQIKVDARKATRIEIQEPPSESGPPRYKALVKLSDGREFSSDDTSLASLSKSPATSPGSATPPPLPPPIVHESIPPVPILTGKVDLTGTREFNLPSPISDVESAQDGRSLLLYLKDAKQVAIFDVIDLKIRGFINVGVDDALIAGGSRHLLVVSHSNYIIQRFSLETLQKEKAVTNPFGDFISITMGRSSPNIALFVAQPPGSSFPIITAFNADRMATLTELPNSRAILSEKNAFVRASADGRTFAMMRPDVSPTGFIILTYRDGVLDQSYYRHDSYGLLVPNADGSQIFTSQSGVYTNKGVPIVKSRWNWAEGITYIPSYHPAFFLGVPYDEIPQRKRKVPKAIGIYSTGATQPLVLIPDGFKEMEPTARQPGRHFDPISVDKRYHFFPQLNLFLTIPPTNDRIVAHGFNVRQALDEKGVDYLYVYSSAPVGKVSTPYRYQLEAASHSGDVTFTLQSGPKGLSIGKEGNVAWTPPAEPADETVIVSLKDKSGQELSYTFRVVTAK